MRAGPAVDVLESRQRSRLGKRLLPIRPGVRRHLGAQPTVLCSEHQLGSPGLTRLLLTFEPFVRRSRTANPWPVKGGLTAASQLDEVLSWSTHLDAAMPSCASVSLRSEVGGGVRIALRATGNDDDRWGGTSSRLSALHEAVYDIDAIADYLIPSLLKIRSIPASWHAHACYILVYMLQRSLCAACSARYTRGALSLIGVGARHSSTSSPGPSRSHIFNEPLDPASRPKSLRRQRQLEQIATARNEISLEEREERARWNADPWCRSAYGAPDCAHNRSHIPDAGAAVRGDSPKDA